MCTLLACEASCHRDALNFEEVLALGASESVFAYARISPDGRALVYSSDTTAGNANVGADYQLRVFDLVAKRILFSRKGIDGWWSNSGDRIIFRDQGTSGDDSVSIWRRSTGQVAQNVASIALGDYFSWATRGGRELIVTIASNYYYLNGDRALLPAERVPSCPGIGRGERPLVSRDGQRITTFVQGTIVVRNLTDCENVFDTGVVGAKADFSWDGRLIAFHAQKPESPNEYEIEVVDIQARTIRHVTAGLSGSSLFPSWTRDGRLCFRHSGRNYNGFIIASNVLSVPPQPPPEPQHLPTVRRWTDIFATAERPNRSVRIVLVWSTWSAHSKMALLAAQRAQASFAASNTDAQIFIATDPGSARADVDAMLRRLSVTLPRINLDARHLALTEATNQVPATLVFRDGLMVSRRLGAQTLGQLEELATQAHPKEHVGR
jgi:hypothetical protein